MKTRCESPTASHYEYYGGAGITVCDGWRNSFEAFLEDMGERPTPQHSLGRFGDVNNYSCGHCQQCKQNGWELNVAWMTKKEQVEEQRVKRALAFLAA